MSRALMADLLMRFRCFLLRFGGCGGGLGGVRGVECCVGGDMVPV